MNNTKKKLKHGLKEAAGKKSENHTGTIYLSSQTRERMRKIRRINYIVKDLPLY